MKYFKLIFYALLVSGCSGSVIENQGLRVEHLACDFLVNPYGLDDRAPVFSWQLLDSVKGQRQTAYRIRVASSDLILKQGQGDVWNSGKIREGNNQNIPFQGHPLRSAAKYYWNVQVWDKDGKASAISTTAFFETGLFLETDWIGKWISAPVIFDWSINDRSRNIMPKNSPPEPGQPAPLFRKAISLRQDISSATLFISGLGFFELHVNGEKTGNHFMDPAFTDYTRTVLYNTFDLTPMLHPGENAVGVMLGNGWYDMASRDVWSFDYAPWRDKPVLSCQLMVNYADGSTDFFPSDLSWKSFPGPVTFNSIRQGETFNDSLLPAGWDKPGYDDHAWFPVRAARKPSGQLKAMTMPSIIIDKEFSPVSIISTGKGQYFVDFGQAMAGFVRLKAMGKAGTIITLRYGELRDKNGRLDQSNINGLVEAEPFQTEIYILNGSGEEEFHPRFTYNGFQYAEVSGYPGVLLPAHITACAIHTSFAPAGTFECSDEILNKIQQSTLWSFMSNYEGYPTDCPHREKNGWTGDAQLASETGLYNFDMNASYLKWIGDLIDEQHDDGLLPGIAPTAGWGYYWGNGPAWDHALFAIPWNTWLYTGDRRLLETAYPAMKKYMGLIKSKSSGYLVNWGLGDWCPARTTTPEIITSTGFFLKDTEIISQTAGLLGHKDDSLYYSMLADSIRLAFVNKLYNAESGVVGNGSQTAQSTALYFGILNEQQSQRCLDKLLENLRTSDLNIDVGILGAKFMLNALSEENETGIAYEHVISKKYPGWANWVMNGATSLWETWNGDASRIHIMYGDISAWFYKNLAGIRLDTRAPGFKHFFIDPYIPPDLDWVNATHESPYGLIKSAWKKNSNGVEFDISVPVNSSATLKLPASTVSEIQVNNEPVRNSPFIFIGKIQNGKINIELTSGSYKFTLKK